MATPPIPQYDYNVNELTKAYETALKDIQRELQSVFLTDYKRAQLQAIEKNISAILSDLAVYAKDWTKQAITQAALDGIASTMVSVGIVPTFEEALTLAKFNQANRSLVAAAIADTQADLLSVTENMNRQAKVAIRQATAEATRSMLTRGDNNIEQLSREVRKRIEKMPDMAIIDASGRRWSVRNYTDMVASTKMMYAHRESSVNEGLADGYSYGRISRHNAVDACRKYEGKIVKLTPDAPGDYPYIGDIPRRELFHPRCKHLVTPIRTPEDVRHLLEGDNTVPQTVEHSDRNVINIIKTEIPKELERKRKRDFEDEDEYYAYREKRAQRNDEIQDAIKETIREIKERPQFLTNHKDAEKWITSNVMRDGFKPDIKDIDIEIVSLYCEIFDKIAKDFPTLKNSFSRFETLDDGSGGIMDALSGIRFGYTKLEDLVTMSSYNVSSGFTVGRNIQDTLVHEIGHMVDRNFGGRGVNGESKAYSVWYDDFMRDKRVKFVQYRNAARNDGDLSAFSKSLSEYGFTNEEEYFAEAFSAMYAGDKRESVSEFSEWIDAVRDADTSGKNIELTPQQIVKRMNGEKIGVEI